MILQCILSTNGCLIPEHFAYRLNEWSEIGFPELGKLCQGIGRTTLDVVNHRLFLKDPHKAAYQIWAKNKYIMAANGAVMRTAVLGIPHFFHESEVVLNVIQCAKVTHADQRCIFSSVVVSAIIARQLRKALGMGVDYEVNHTEKEELLKLVDTIKTAESNRTYDGSEVPLSQLYNPKEATEVKPPEYPEKPNEEQVSEFTSCSTDPIKFSTSSCGEDDASMELIKNVISEYKFLLKSSNWEEELEKFCFASSLNELELDEKSSIGYTFKCLGAGLFCFSRRQPVGMNDGDFFKAVITELVLEGGDSDTNAAVAGALLGCRLGMQGLPNDWWEGIRNLPFLTKISDDLVGLVKKQIDSVGM